MKLWPFNRREERARQIVTWQDLLETIQDVRGDNITTRQASKQPTTFSSIRAISSAISTLPVLVYEGEKNKQEEVTGPLQKLIAVSPRPGWTAKKFWAWILLVHLKRGRAVALILRSASGRAVGLQPLMPTCLSVDLVERNGWLDLRYTYSSKTSVKTYWPEDVLDFTFDLDEDMTTAISPLKELLPHLSLVNDLHEYARNAFRDVPPMILQTREGLAGNNVSTQSAIKAAQAFTKLLKRKDLRSLPVPPGFEAKSFGITAEQLQLAQLGRYINEDSAKGFNISPAFLGDLSKSSYRSAEAAALHFVKFVCMPITAMLEQEVNLKLLGNGNRIMRLDFTEFLRGDMKSLADALNILRTGGFITSNEGRRKLGMPDKEQDGADELVMQLAMGSISEAMADDEDKEDEDDEDSGQGIGDEGSTTLPDGLDSP